MGNLGVVLALALLMVMAFRGVNILIASLLASAVIALSNNKPLTEALFDSYSSGMMGFAGTFFIVFLAGAIFGRVMGESKAAHSVAYALSRAFGDSRALWITMVACAVLTYGGVNVFIVVFTVYPLGLGLMQRTNMPKRLFNAAAALGAGTFTMTALPGTPSIQNIIPAETLRTPLTASPAVGVVASIIMILLGMWYLERRWKSARARGESFHPSATDAIPEKEPAESEMPHWLVACIPLTLVVGTIIFPRIFISFAGSSPDGSIGFLAMSSEEPLVWTAFALLIGTLVALVLFNRFLPHPVKTLGRGAENSLLPLLNTSSIIGFGAVVGTTAVFKSFANLFMGSTMHPLLATTVSTNVICGLVGSASGGLRIWTETFANHFVTTGVDPALLHRIACMAAGGLDSLPHSGAVITSLTIMGLTHREAYRDMAVITIAVPLAAIAILLAFLILTGA